MRRLLADGWTLATTNLVAGETYTLMRTRLGAAAALRFLEAIRTSPTTRRVSVTAEWEIAAEELLARYADQDFSYVDATSFVAMRRLGLRQAFAFDHHFVVAGFKLLGDVEAPGDR